jgi:hypothetical protein
LRKGKFAGKCDCFQAGFTVLKIYPAEISSLSSLIPNSGAERALAAGRASRLSPSEQPGKILPVATTQPDRQDAGPATIGKCLLQSSVQNKNAGQTIFLKHIPFEVVLYGINMNIGFTPSS